ncbi:MAG: hypothetical protein HZC41_21935 [Chloroflexi bacterium]|nr:hypothetical protein [Chloroflexota bacterium]
MKLPNLERALIEENKIVGYLLHDENSGGKATFFAAFGFRRAHWDRLRDALLAHAAAHEVTRRSETPHGIKYIIEGVILTPDGRSPLVRAVWIVNSGSEFPRLVTAYPIDEVKR